MLVKRSWTLLSPRRVSLRHAACSKRATEITADRFAELLVVIELAEEWPGRLRTTNVAKLHAL